ncbi:MAG: type 12 methyltransferase [Candidatus Peregrinibacteria bacterium GW2011_GWC2_33_13]|nr:MAG: type 12 methyltransferase [Candidatus Peregrinibacteria bacterium GW2011_GWC2_33_13]
MLLNLFAILALIFTFILVLSACVCLFYRVPYVPTKKRLIETLLKTAKPHKGQTIYDLGCGDGRLLFAAEKKYHTKCIGYELSPIAYFLAMIKKIIQRSKSKIYLKNFFKAKISDAEIIFLYLTPAILKKLVKKVKKECHKGTIIVSHTFHIEGLKPLKIIKRDKKNKIPIIYIYKI